MECITRVVITNGEQWRKENFNSKGERSTLVRSVRVTEGTIYHVTDRGKQTRSFYESEFISAHGRPKRDTRLNKPQLPTNIKKFHLTRFQCY